MIDSDHADFVYSKYSAYFGDWCVKRLPLPATNTPHRYQNIAATPLLYFNQHLQLRPPVLFHAACLTFGLRTDRDPEISGSSGMMDPFAELGLNAEEVQPVASHHFDFGRLNASINSPTTPSTASLLRALSTHAPQTPLAVLKSEAHDVDLARLSACNNLYSGRGLTVAQLKGTLKGTWEGRFSFFDFDSYRDMLGGRVRSLYDGPFRAQPQVWKIEEIIVRLSDDTVEGGQG